MAGKPTGDPLKDARRLRKLLRKARKVSKDIRRAAVAAEWAARRAATSETPQTPAPPVEEAEPLPQPLLPRWLLSGKQLHDIVTRLDLSDPGTYAKTAEALGITGDLYAMIAETHLAAYQRNRFALQKDRWLESYRDARSAYAWHLAMADAARAAEKEGGLPWQTP